MIAIAWVTKVKRPLEYLIIGAPKSKKFRGRFRAPFLGPPTVFPSFFPPLSPAGPVPSCGRFPLFTSPFAAFRTPGKLRFRYPCDLRTFWCPSYRRGESARISQNLRRNLRWSSQLFPGVRYRSGEGCEQRNGRPKRENGQQFFLNNF